ncbi:DUF6744 family protein [Desulfitobacterium chlororespirans]|uniref:Uncharacterized protein n=1 Tax=Desulfitobacterium chlororespirans DSM 11544 TaxID=1121395 RepID=A0A1M7UUC8_9FIRM|nr:DUF6744 family protein [Desulfitobacterium chlororespirans]SHN86550.1 hypothetical protein SAMN02745215_04661 [Desulfitobacterium chlororespirans DSM 11544]
MVLENMVATTNEAEDNGHLGNLFWFSIGDDTYNRNLLEQTLIQVGLSLSHMPHQIRLVDAFRRATKEIECSLNPSNGVSENFIVRDVYSDTSTVIRHIVKETVDSKGKRLSYNEDEAVLTLDKKTEVINFKGDETGYAATLFDEAKRYFAIFKENHNGQAVRGMVQNILKTLSPTPVRPSGGVYFVPAAHDEDLGRLVAFCSAFPKGEGFKIPVIKSVESIEMIEKKISDHLDGVINQCRFAAGESTLTKGKLAEIINDTKTVVSGYRDYETIISMQKRELDSKVQLIRDMMGMLLDKGVA